MEQVHDKKAWDKFVDESPGGTLFHKWDFLKIVERFTGHRLYTYGIYSGNDMAAAIPFFLSIRGGGIRMMQSPPPTRMANMPYLGFAMSREFEGLSPVEKVSAMADILEGMHRGLREASPNYISIGLNSTITDARPFGWDHYAIDQQYTYILDLRRPLEKIWEGFDRDCRKNISECAGHPLWMKRMMDVEAFNEIMKSGLTKDGPTFYHQRDPAYLRELLEAFPDNIKLYFFYNGDEQVGVKINAGYKKHYMSWMGNVAMQKKLNVNEFFYWEMIKKAKEEGYERHENYGTINLRLNTFKSKFNPTLEPCFYVEKKDSLYRAVEYCYGHVTNIAGKARP
jgi:lipid II:glycine glycyltransferase (peptidoglycan interpeptide bridge formation enzyme)